LILPPHTFVLVGVVTNKELRGLIKVHKMACDFVGDNTNKGEKYFGL
jgi:hypothetical protein